MISLKNLCFTFPGASRTLFSHTDFTFAESKLTFIEGKNGAGKSTLFQILMAQPELQPFVTGTLSHKGVTYDLASSTYAQFARDHLSRVPQRFDELLAPHLTFQENLACAHFGRFPSFRSRVVLPPVPDLATSLHIPLDVPVAVLSGGQRQILAILTVLQRSSSLLLLDEPTATLDEENSALVMECIRTLIAQRGITVLMISHDSSLYASTDTQPMSITKSNHQG